MGFFGGLGKALGAGIGAMATGGGKKAGGAGIGGGSVLGSLRRPSIMMDDPAEGGLSGQMNRQPPMTKQPKMTARDMFAKRRGVQVNRKMTGAR